MKVILLSTIAGLGKKSEIKEVSDGHARNFLIPKGLAVQATPESIKKLQAISALQDKEEKALKGELSHIAAGLNGSIFDFSLKTDAKGSVFGSVGKDAILKALRDSGGLGRHRAEIKLDHPLKDFGDHAIEVALEKGIRATITARIHGQP